MCVFHINKEYFLSYILTYLLKYTMPYGDDNDVFALWQLA